MGSKLASYACHEKNSKGRFKSEHDPDALGCYWTDLDKIQTSSAYNRLGLVMQMIPFPHLLELTYREQPLSVPSNFPFHTRLTHTDKARFCARWMATKLGLNPVVAEAIVAIHDVGHAPYGHSGEAALDANLKKHGYSFGYNHNDGAVKLGKELNLTLECMDGIINHDQRVYERSHKLFPDITQLLAEQFPNSHHTSGEGQIAAIADPIAYRFSDLEDAYNFEGLEEINYDFMLGLPLVGAYIKHARDKGLCISDKDENNRAQIVKRGLELTQIAFMRDMVAETDRRLNKLNPKSAEAIRQADDPIVSFSPQMEKIDNKLAKIIKTNIHDAMKWRDAAAHTIIDNVFEHEMTLYISPRTKTTHAKAIAARILEKDDYTTRQITSGINLKAFTAVYRNMAPIPKVTRHLNPL